MKDHATAYASEMAPEPQGIVSVNSRGGRSAAWVRPPSTRRSRKANSHLRRSEVGLRYGRKAKYRDGLSHAWRRVVENRWLTGAVRERIPSPRLISPAPGRTCGWASCRVCPLHVLHRSVLCKFVLVVAFQQAWRPTAPSVPMPQLVLDEFTALGKVGIVAKANAYISGYNIRLLTIIQSVSQLEAIYGPAETRTLVTNHALQILYPPREQKDAREYSEMLGFFTLKSISTGVNRPRAFGQLGSSSENASDQRRALMLPQELKEMDDAEQIIITENTRPILCEKAKYFMDGDISKFHTSGLTSAAALTGR